MSKARLGKTHTHTQRGRKEYPTPKRGEGGEGLGWNLNVLHINGCGVDLGHTHDQDWS